MEKTENVTSNLKRVQFKKKRPKLNLKNYNKVQF